MCAAAKMSKTQQLKERWEEGGARLRVDHA